MNTAEVTQQVAAYFAPSSQAVAGILIRRLAGGTPVSRSEAATLIGCQESDLDAQLAQLPFRVEVDDQNWMIGAGLALRPTQYQFVSWSNQRKDATILSLHDAFALARKMARGILRDRRVLIFQ